MSHKLTIYDAYKLFHKGTLAFARAEREGICVDLKYCKKESRRLDRKIDQLITKFKNSRIGRNWIEFYGLKTNFDSSTQLETILYRKCKIRPVKHTRGGKGSTDEDALRQLQIEELDILLQIRRYKKARDTYLKAFITEQVNGFLHPSFLLNTVSTFRSSSRDPNFQNIPKRDKEIMQMCRRALVARPGRQFLEVDFSGIEVMIAACYHRDPEMLRYLKDPKADMHGDTAYDIFFLKSFRQKIKQVGSIKLIPELKVLRDCTKNGFVFPEFYGDYYESCAPRMACDWGKLPSTGKWKSNQGIRLVDNIFLGQHLISNGIRSLHDFTEHVRKVEDKFWNERFPIYYAWRKKWYRVYQQKGYFDTLTGFRCQGIMHRNKTINYPVQGAAFHCLLWTFIQVNKLICEKRMKSRLIGQVHDSLVLDIVPSEKDDLLEFIRDIAENQLLKSWKWIIIPLTVEAEISPVDGSWADIEPVSFEG